MTSNFNFKLQTSYATSWIGTTNIDLQKKVTDRRTDEQTEWSCHSFSCSSQLKSQTFFVSQKHGGFTYQRWQRNYYWVNFVVYSSPRARPDFRCLSAIIRVLGKLTHMNRRLLYLKFLYIFVARIINDTNRLLSCRSNFMKASLELIWSQQEQRKMTRKFVLQISLSNKKEISIKIVLLLDNSHNYSCSNIPFVEMSMNLAWSMTIGLLNFTEIHR